MVKAGYAHDRAKYFALNDLIALQATGQQRWLVVKPRAGVRGGTGDQFDMRLAKRPLDKTGDAIALTAADQRADFVVFIALAGKAQAGDSFTQRVHQLRVNPRLRVDTTGGGAILAGVVIAVSADAADHFVEIGIVTDNHRRFTAQFQMRAFDAFRRRLQNFLPGHDIAGHRYQPNLRVADQMAADALPAAVQNVQHPRRQDLLQCRHQRQNAQRGMFGRFEYHGVARGQRRGDFPCRHHQRIIPRRNRGHHADRIAADH